MNGEATFNVGRTRVAQNISRERVKIGLAIPPRATMAATVSLKNKHLNSQVYL